MDLLPSEIICEIIKELAKSPRYAYKFIFTNRRVFYIYKENKTYIFPNYIIIQQVKLDTPEKELDYNKIGFTLKKYTFKINRYHGNKKMRIYYSVHDEKEYKTIYFQLTFYYYSERPSHIKNREYVYENEDSGIKITTYFYQEYFWDDNIKTTINKYIEEKFKRFEYMFGFHRRELKI